ncbi:MAG TPA: hypothetical protein VN698_02455 [Bacteroidia bacterium]|nr:hypothetical protein [Bacteroidia bacterium]
MSHSYLTVEKLPTRNFKINDSLTIVVEEIHDDYFRTSVEFYIEHIQGRAKHMIGMWDNARTTSFINQFICNNDDVDLSNVRVGKKIGEIGVDGGQVMIADPCYFSHDENEQEHNIQNRIQLEQARNDAIYQPTLQVNYPTGHAGLAVISSTSYGDGSYDCVDLVDGSNRKIGIGVIFGGYEENIKSQLNDSDIMHIAGNLEQIQTLLNNKSKDCALQKYHSKEDLIEDMKLATVVIQNLLKFLEDPNTNYEVENNKEDL